MAILYDSATGRYIEVSPNDLRNLAQNVPALNAQYAYMNGVDRIGVRGTITPNLLVVPKTGIVKFFTYGGLNLTSVAVTAGTPIGVTTGRGETCGTNYLTSDSVEVKLSVSLGKGSYVAGQSYYVRTCDVELKAMSGSGGGGNLLFPIKYGATNNSAVMQFQAWLKGCGHFVSSFTPNGNWGDATQAGAQKEGISVINSQAELDEIVKRPCRSAGGGSSGGGGGGVTPIDTNPVVVPPAPVQDNTWMYVAGAVGVAVVVKSMQGKKKKKR